MTTFLHIRFRLFFLLVLFFLVALGAQSSVLLILTARHRAEAVPVQAEAVVETGAAAIAAAEQQPGRWSGFSGRRCLWPAAAFVVVNALIFGVVLFFRIDGRFVRPLERVSLLAEQFGDEEMLFRDALVARQPFRALGQRLRLMLERIESDRRRLQRQVEELEKMNAELVASRVQLVRSEKLAIAGQLSAGLAHEIGNPLAIVSGYLDLLKMDDVIGSDRVEFADKSRREIERVERLISQLLEFSRTESAEKVELVPVDFLHECVELASMHSAVRCCRLRVESEHLEAAVCPLHADLLHQVILNCVLNAADALKEQAREDGEIVVAARRVKGADAKTVLRFEVRDNGAGVSGEVAARMFEPFFTTKEAGKGTGLGLFVSQLLVARMGGEIVAENVDGGFSVHWELEC